MPPPKLLSFEQRTPPPNTVEYPPYEVNERSADLNQAEREELLSMHKLYKVSVFTGDYNEFNYKRLIGDYVQQVPYTSDKRNLGQGVLLDLFGYTFVVQEGDKKNERWQVLWDYKSGLVRMTPFFRALDLKKTEPKIAIESNAGLLRFAPNITGGSIPAQGYWMPFDCAREMCLTFCYNIRWVLTPMFGQKFIKQCLPPNHHHFRNYRISALTLGTHILQNARARSAASMSTPVSNIRDSPVSTPRAARKNKTGLRVKSKPEELSSSALSSIEDEETHPNRLDTPPISPKTIWPPTARDFTAINTDTTISHAVKESRKRGFSAFSTDTDLTTDVPITYPTFKPAKESRRATKEMKARKSKGNKAKHTDWTPAPEPVPDPVEEAKPRGGRGPDRGPGRAFGRGARMKYVSPTPIPMPTKETTDAASAASAASKRGPYPWEKEETQAPGWALAHGFQSERKYTQEELDAAASMLELRYGYQHSG